MGWVLTGKSDGTSKARLVALGFQMGHITEVETAAPTMSRVSRYLLLTLCANKGYRLKAGDVMAAFLQADASLESQEMTVWAPAELAVLFGAPPANPSDHQGFLWTCASTSMLVYGYLREDETSRMEEPPGRSMPIHPVR